MCHCFECLTDGVLKILITKLLEWTTSRCIYISGAYYYPINWSSLMQSYCDVDVCVCRWTSTSPRARRPTTQWERQPASVLQSWARESQVSLWMLLCDLNRGTAELYIIAVLILHTPSSFILLLEELSVVWVGVVTECPPSSPSVLRHYNTDTYYPQHLNLLETLLKFVRWVNKGYSLYHSVWPQRRSDMRARITISSVHWCHCVIQKIHYSTCNYSST